MVDLEELFRLNDHHREWYDESLRDAYNAFLPLFVDLRNGVAPKPKYAAIEGMVQYGLSEAEAFFILEYTARSSRWVNEDLRAGRRLSTPDKILFVEALDSALNKIPSYNNRIVYRMDKPHGEKADIIKWFEIRKGAEFGIPYFLSTAQEDYHNSPIVWQIRTLNEGSFAKNISNLTNDAAELEVLFKRGANFRIAGVDNKKSYVFLEEIPSEAAVDFSLIDWYYSNSKS
ncbi:MAG: hypothetical protein ICV78_09950 [Tolypothrix sp. Co-bin9]|nr:hypothetical protein [Tolypothrix sp. Co-bin9]